jgi:ribosomal protein S18 acetylase RimI-like enzyme
LPDAGPVSIERVDTLDRLRGEAAALHARAHGRVPHGARAREFRDQTLPRHAERADFRFVGAFSGGTLVGFGYGYTGRPGQWWHDRVAAAMDEEARARWLDPLPFELVELAVEPELQSRGIGARLLAALLDGLPHARALLTARRDDERVQRFYARHGWAVVVDELRFGAEFPVYSVLGRELAD